MSSPVRPENLGSIPDSEKTAQLEELEKHRLEQELTELQAQKSRLEHLTSAGGEPPHKEVANRIDARIAQIKESLGLG